MGSVATAGGAAVIRVLLVDDHPVVLQGLKSYLALDEQIDVAAAVGTAAEALQLVSAPGAAAPDVVLMDMHLPDMDGPQAVRALKARCPSAVVVALSSFAEDSLVVGALRAGAAGYLFKAIPPEQLLEAVKAAAAGVPVLHPDVQRLLLVHAAQHAQAESLSARELEVLQCMGRGLSNKEIGAALHITEKTVKTHVSHILAKLNVQDRTQAVLAGIRDHYIAAP